MSKFVKIFKQDPNEYLIKTKQKDVEKLVKYASDKYYNTEKPVLTDAEYDLAFEYLKSKYPCSKLIENIGAPILAKKKVELPYHMGSMSKIKPNTGDIQKWIKKFNGPYVSTDKIDGTSALFIIDETNDKYLYSRGNGKVGSDLSHLIKYMPSLKKKFKKEIVVRGELIISRENFKKYPKFVNARCLVNSLANKKKPDVSMLKHIDFVAYELIKPWSNASDQYLNLKKMKFNVVHNQKLKKLDDDNLSKLLRTRKEKSKYDIDGLVIFDDNPHNRNKDGNPKYAFAFKDLLEDAIKETSILKVEWNVSKHGKLKPRIHIKSVLIDGITIKHTTGFNAKYINDNKLGPKSIIKITRSGDVIPYIVSVVKSTKASLPDMKTVKWNSTKVDLVLKNKDDSEQHKVKNLTHFVRTLEIKYLDESLIKKFIEVDIDTPGKILKVTKKKLLTVENFKEKMASKIYKNIRGSIKQVKLEKLVHASNIFGGGIGQKKLKLVFEKYPKAMEWKFDKEDVIDKIKLVEGFSTKSATQFAVGLTKYQKFIKTLPKITYAKSKVIKKLGKFKDIKVVFTGFRNKEWEKVLNMGSGVTSNIGLVVAKDIDDKSSKLEKARKLGIKIVSFDDFSKNF